MLADPEDIYANLFGELSFFDDIAKCLCRGDRIALEILCIVTEGVEAEGNIFHVLLSGEQ